MEHASHAAAALGRNEPIVPLHSSLAEANAITAALEGASAELDRRAEHQRLLLNELSHRVKNLLAVVQAIIMRTLTGERPPQDARDTLIERLQALGGSSLLEAALPTDLSVKPRLTYNAEGFVYEIEAPLSTLQGT